MIGQTVSHYTILEKLGEGGMGVVYKARDTKLDRDVALKFLPDRVNENEAEKARFLQEAKAAGGLNHPNICTIHSVEENGASIFMVMEYIDGGTLRKKIPFAKTDDAVAAAMQIAEALQEAHSKGIVHRDVKADNVMMTSRGQVKVMDFGLAKLKGSLKLTKTSSTVGTLGYMAPEQIQGGEVDHRSDIFSFGVLLFEMLTGKLPFRGEHEAAMVYSIVNEEPQDVTQLVPDLSPIVANLIQRCLEKDPGERYQHFDDIVADLKRSQKKTSRVMRSGSHAASGTGAVSGTRPALGGDEVASHDAGKDATGKKWMKPALIGVAAVILAAVGVVLFMPSSGPTTANGKTIAVLPFENMSGEDDATFSAGITEDILTQISKVADLRVLSRFTLKEYDSKGKTPVEIGKELGVANLLVGSIRRSGDRLRIGCQLIETAGGEEVWAETYDRTMDDVFAIQSEVAQQIARTLKVRLSPEEEGRLGKKPTADTEAYRIYLTGRQLYERQTREDNEKAIEYFRRALQKDPEFALPWAGLGDAYGQAVNRYRTLDRGWLDSAEAASQRAIELDPDASEGWKAVGLVKSMQGLTTAAIQAYVKAVEKDPTNDGAVNNLGIVYKSLGELDKAVQWYRKAIEINPLQVNSYQNLANIYNTLGNYSAAHAWLDKAMTLPENDRFYTSLDRAFIYLSTGQSSLARQYADSMVSDVDHAFAYEMAGTVTLLCGDSEGAEERFRKAIRLSPAGYEKDPDNGSSMYLGYLLLKRGNRDSARMLLDRTLELQLHEISQGDESSIREALAAEIYATLGEKDEAIARIRKAVAKGDREYHWYLLDPMFENIRDDARFIEIIDDLKAKVAEMRRKVDAMENL